MALRVLLIQIVPTRDSLHRVILSKIDKFFGQTNRCYFPHDNSLNYLRNNSLIFNVYKEVRGSCISISGCLHNIPVSAVIPTIAASCFSTSSTTGKAWLTTLARSVHTLLSMHLLRPTTSATSPSRRNESLPAHVSPLCPVVIRYALLAIERLK